MARTNQQALDWIRGQIAAGRGIAVTTHLKQMRFSPRTLARHKAAGIEPFRLDGAGDLRMVEGFTRGKPRYVVLIVSAVGISSF